MKLIGIMNLANDRAEVRKLFEKHGVQIYSETDITGHTLTTLERYGWRPSTDIPVYSSLCFAIIADERAEEIMGEISRLSQADVSGHPIRAFQVDVELMI